jgi:hypothetical protein
MNDNDKSSMEEAFEELERAGLIVKTGEMRDGQPTYVAVEFATEEQLKAARARKQ